MYSRTPNKQAGGRHYYRKLLIKMRVETTPTYRAMQCQYRHLPGLWPWTAGTAAAAVAVAVVYSAFCENRRGRARSDAVSGPASQRLIVIDGTDGVHSVLE